MKLCKLIVALFFGMVLFPAQQATANVVSGDFVNVFAGNDSEAALESLFPALSFTQLAKVETPDTSNGGLGLDLLVFTGTSNQPTSGQWGYTGPESVDYFVVKAGNNYALYHYTDANTLNMRNIGHWDTTELENKGMSHVTAYSVSTVPIPTAVWLLGSGLIGLVGISRRHRLK